MLTSDPTQRRRRAPRLGFFARRDGWTWSLDLTPTSHALSNPRSNRVDTANGLVFLDNNPLFDTAHGLHCHDLDAYDSDEERLASSYTYTTRWFLSSPVIKQCQYLLLFSSSLPRFWQGRPTFSVFVPFLQRSFLISPCSSPMFTFLVTT